MSTNMRIWEQVDKTDTRYTKPAEVGGQKITSRPSEPERWLGCDLRQEPQIDQGKVVKAEKTGAAKHSADYLDRKKAEADRLDIEKMHFDMPAGIRKQLAAELAVHGYSQVQELWQDLALS
ncbi:MULTISPECIES: hypothetical protein [unclassified Pseudomonas]|uniref:hypothetical protein n=1 Tax=unclassified Pseudomonas TaxID=196821 RepID=UPI000A8B7807|nr:MULTISPECIES: hypothetical protein [unclassified Pseudomonas]